MQVHRSEDPRDPLGLGTCRISRSREQPQRLLGGFDSRQQVLVETFQAFRWSQLRKSRPPFGETLDGGLESAPEPGQVGRMQSPLDPLEPVETVQQGGPEPTDLLEEALVGVVTHRGGH